jgi:hypothetical protein
VSDISLVVYYVVKMVVLLKVSEKRINLSMKQSKSSIKGGTTSKMKGVALLDAILSNKEYEVIAIRWMDARSTHGWCSPTEVLGIVKVESVGILFVEDDTGVTLTTSINTDFESTDPITIPKKWITGRRTLGKVTI